MEKIWTVVARIAEKRIVKYQYLWDPMTLTTANIKELAWTLEDPKHLLILNAHLVGKKYKDLFKWKKQIAMICVLN